MRRDLFVKGSFQPASLNFEGVELSEIAQPQERSHAARKMGFGLLSVTLSVVTSTQPRSVKLHVPPALSLLTTTPGDLRSHFDWPVQQKSQDRVQIIWAALRKGIDVLDDAEAATTKYIKPKLLRELKPAAAAVSASATQADAVKSSDGTQKLLLRLRCLVCPARI